MTYIPPPADPHVQQVQLLVRGIARTLAKDVHLVRIRITYEPDSTIFHLNVSCRDLIQVLGADGKRAQSIASIVQFAGAKLNRRFFLEIEGVDGPQLVESNGDVTSDIV